MREQHGTNYQLVKNLTATQETWVRSLGWEALLKGTATHSSILAWIIPWTEEPGGHNPWGCKELDTTERLIRAELSGC